VAFIRSMCYNTLMNKIKLITEHINLRQQYAGFEFKTVDKIIGYVQVFLTIDTNTIIKANDFLRHEIGKK
jgi:3-methyladenine DNA glycosylase Tag